MLAAQGLGLHWVPATNKMQQSKLKVTGDSSRVVRVTVVLKQAGKGR